VCVSAETQPHVFPMYTKTYYLCSTCYAIMYTVMHHGQSKSTSICFIIFRVHLKINKESTWKYLLNSKLLILTIIKIRFNFLNILDGWVTVLRMASLYVNFKLKRNNNLCNNTYKYKCVHSRYLMYSTYALEAISGVVSPNHWWTTLIGPRLLCFSCQQCFQNI